MTQPLALITGASAGMGAEYARQLAAKGYRLLLVARSESALTQLAQQLNTHTTIVSVDLACDQSRQQFYQAYASELAQVELLIANAGVGNRQPLEQQSLAEIKQVVQLNILGLTELVQQVGHTMLVRGRGQVILVASIVAWMHTGDYALYSASKAYVLHLGKALQTSWGKQGVQLMVSCPSTTQTEFFQRANQQLSRFQRVMAMSPEAVCKITLKHLDKQRRVSVPGRLNQLFAFVLRRLAA